MGTRSAVFDGFGPPCASVPHEWQRLGTWTVYCRRCYHHHRRACRCPACAPAIASRRNRPTHVVGSGRTEEKPSDGQQCLLPFLETSA
jgi:hypothetical protein